MADTSTPSLFAGIRILMAVRMETSMSIHGSYLSSKFIDKARVRFNSVGFHIGSK